MELYFLGTGAGSPTKKRNVTSVALRLLGERGALWMFDCGEGTQHQVLKSPLKLSKLEKLFITHLHGDHLYGLPGLLTSRAYQGGESPLTVFGPTGVKAYIELSLQVSQAHLTYELHVQEIDADEQGTVIYEDEQCTVEMARVEHRIDSYGYRIVERDQPGKLDAGKLEQLGVAPGPLYGKLKRGEAITLADGTTVRPEDVVGPKEPGRIVVVLGDTRPCPSAVRLARNADVLVHEATFAAGLGELAHTYYHSTTEQAARTAKEAQARALIMTHISSRYADEDVEQLQNEAKAIFENAYVAHDLWMYPIVKTQSPSSRT